MLKTTINPTIANTRDLLKEAKEAILKRQVFNIPRLIKDCQSIEQKQAVLHTAIEANKSSYIIPIAKPEMVKAILEQIGNDFSGFNLSQLFDILCSNDDKNNDKTQDKFVSFFVSKRIIDAFFVLPSSNTHPKPALWDVYHLFCKSFLSIGVSAKLPDMGFLEFSQNDTKLHSLPIEVAIPLTNPSSDHKIEDLKKEFDDFLTTSSSRPYNYSKIKQTLESENCQKNPFFIHLSGIARGACLAAHNHDLDMLETLKTSLKNFDLFSSEGNNSIYANLSPIEIILATSSIDFIESLLDSQKNGSKNTNLISLSNTISFEKIQARLEAAPFYFAASAGRKEFLELSRKNGISLNCPFGPIKSQTPMYLLWFACASGDTEVVEYLTTEENTITQKNNNSSIQTPVLTFEMVKIIGCFIAAKNGHLNALKSILTSIRNQPEVQLNTIFSENSLKRGVKQTSELSLDSSYVREFFGYSLFSIACVNGRSEVAEYLINNMKTTYSVLDSKMLDETSITVAKKIRHSIEINSSLPSPYEWITIVKLIIENKPGKDRTFFLKLLDELNFNTKAQLPLFNNTEKVIYHTIIVNKLIFKHALSNFKKLPTECELWYCPHGGFKKQITADTLASFLLETIQATISKIELLPKNGPDKHDHLIPTLYNKLIGIFQSYDPETVLESGTFSKDECETISIAMQNIFKIDEELSQRLLTTSRTNETGIKSIQSVASRMEFFWSKNKENTKENMNKNNDHNNNQSMTAYFDLDVKRKNMNDSNTNDKSKSNNNNNFFN